MLGKLSSGDGLLLLFEAAKHIVNDEPAKPSKLPSSEYNKSRQNSSQFTHPIIGSNRKQTQKFPPRSSHNELEKSRRAHLRTCMESLKMHLNFDTDATRITMLSILKKASKTIQELKDENKSLQEAEVKQKSKWNQLMKKKNHLKKRIENRRYNRKIQNWRERNRNYSECSIATTSSEESELDQNSRGSNTSEQRLVFQTPSPVSMASRESLYLRNSKFNDEPYVSSTKAFKSLSGNSSAGTSPPPFSNVYDTSDGCSLDSGYEENQILTPNSFCNMDYGLTALMNNQLLPNRSLLNPSLKTHQTLLSQNNQSKASSFYVDSTKAQHQRPANINSTSVKRISPPFTTTTSSARSKKFHSTFVRTDIPIENCGA